MTSILQWTALVVCILCTAWRFPAMLKGRNRGLFWIFAMASFAVGLSIEPLYLPVDALLGGINVANVLLRLSLFGATFLLARKVAAAYKSDLAAQLISGPVGITILALCSMTIWVSFLVSTKAPSSTGLSDLPSEPALSVYTTVGMAYLAYGAVCVVLPTGKAAFSQSPLLNRVSAMLMCIGFILAVVSVCIQFVPEPDFSLVGMLAFSAILFVSVSLALVWISFSRRPAPRKTTR